MCVLPRQPGLEYFVEHTAGHLLILTNLSTQQHLQQQPSQQEFAQPSQAATDYSLYTVPVASVLAAGSGGCLQDWRPLLLEAPGTAVTDMNAFDGVVVLHTLHHSRPQLMLLHVGTGQQQERTLEVSLQQEVSWGHVEAAFCCVSAFCCECLSPCHGVSMSQPVCSLHKLPLLGASICVL